MWTLEGEERGWSTTSICLTIIRTGSLYHSSSLHSLHSPYSLSSLCICSPSLNHGSVFDYSIPVAWGHLISQNGQYESVDSYLDEWSFIERKMSEWPLSDWITHIQLDLKLIHISRYSMTSRVICSTLFTWHTISSSLINERMDTLNHSSFWPLLHLSLSLFSSLLFTSRSHCFSPSFTLQFSSLSFSLSLLSLPLVSSISIISLLSTRDFLSISQLISIPSGVTLFIHFSPLFLYSTGIVSYWSTLAPSLTISLRSNYSLSRNAFHSFDWFLQFSRLE